MPLSVTHGIAIIWGVRPQKPIANIPADARRVKVKMRPTKEVRAFLKFDDRVEEWVIGPSGNVTNADTWELRFKRGENRAIK